MGARMEFGEIIKSLREERGMSRYQFCDKTGLDQKRLEEWELGINSEPTEDEERRLARGFGMTLEELNRIFFPEFPEDEHEGEA
jgi:transcriptional regulator with XRE-family HTH domain